MKKLIIIKTKTQRDKFCQQLAEYDLNNGPLSIEYQKYKSKRSAEQNALMWVWYGEIQKHIREQAGEYYTTEQIHEHFVRKFMPMRRVAVNERSEILEKIINKISEYFPGVDMEELFKKESAIWVRAKTSKFTIKEMSDYMNALDMYCEDELNLILPQPEVI